MKKTAFFLIIIIITFTACRGKLHKKVTETYPDGSPKTELFYKGEGANQKLVKEIKFYQNHQKQDEGEYKDSLRDGKWTYWREDGKLWSEGYFKKGLRDGKGSVYYENGKKFYDCEYKNNERIGIWKFWDETGKPMKEINYDTATK